jgi:hypothetical protein
MKKEERGYLLPVFPDRNFPDGKRIGFIAREVEKVLLGLPEHTRWLAPG